MYGRENPYRQEEQAPPPQRRSSRAAALTRPIAVASCVLGAICFVGCGASMAFESSAWGSRLFMAGFIIPLLGAGYRNWAEQFVAGHPELDARGDLERGEDAMEDLWKWFGGLIIVWILLGAGLGQWLA